MVTSSSTLRSAAASSHLERGDSWDLHLGLDVRPGNLCRKLGGATAGSSCCDLRMDSLHFEQDVGGVVILVGVGVVLCCSEGTWILLAWPAWPLLVLIWTCEASGEVAHLHLALGGSHLLCHELVSAHLLASGVLGWPEDGRGNFTASSWTAHGLTRTERSESPRVLLRVGMVNRRSHWASKVSREAPLRPGFESCVGTWVAWRSAHANELVLLMLLGRHKGRGSRSRAVESVHPGVGLRWTWRLEHVEVLVRHGRALLGHLLRLEL